MLAHHHLGNMTFLGGTKENEVDQLIVTSLHSLRGCFCSSQCIYRYSFIRIVIRIKLLSENHRQNLGTPVRIP